jgi:phage/plasmid-like protein (TIGR03299 family)
MDIPTAIALSGLGFQVEKVQARDELGNLLDNSFFLRCTDTGLVVGENKSKRYKAIQNDDCFNVLRSVVTEGAATIEAAGSHKKRRVVYITAKLPGELVVKGVDISTKKLIVANSFDGSLVGSVFFSTTRAVCENTLLAALTEAGKELGIHRVRHTGDVTAKMAQAAIDMGIVNSFYSELQDRMNDLANRPINHKDALDYLARCFKLDLSKPSEIEQADKDKLSTVLSLVDREGQRIPQIGATAWALFNATTDFLQHETKTRNEANRQYNNTFGDAATDSRKAFRYALDLLTV